MARTIRNRQVIYSSIVVERPKGGGDPLVTIRIDFDPKVHDEDTRAWLAAGLEEMAGRIKRSEPGFGTVSEVAGG